MLLLLLALTACSEAPVEDTPPVDTSNMAFIPAGVFTMGAPEGEGAPDEHPSLDEI